MRATRFFSSIALPAAVSDRTAGAASALTFRSPRGASLALCSSAILLGACAGSFRSPEEPADLIPDRSAEITLGQTQRADIRANLGEPFVASQYWQFDLFRASTEQTEVAFALTPWPVPFARFKDHLLRYTLVTYDPDGRAAGVTSGLFRQPAEWRSASPIESDYMDLHLRTGELLLFVDRGLPRTLRLMVTPAGRDRYLASLGRTGECTLILGCGPAACGDRVSVDGAEPIHLPLRINPDDWTAGDGAKVWLADTGIDAGRSEAPWLEVLVPLTLQDGEHTLEFSARFLDGDTSTPLTCVAGDLLFGEIGAQAEDGTWRQKLVEWRIEFSRDMPLAFRRRPLVLTEDERWLLPPEPADPTGATER